ncbi:MAG TPA: hypothetical protein HPP80_04630 [Rhodospirillaceae bacterium]|nr:hypothetical protein [Rhodospirillaceae bacterium]
MTENILSRMLSAKLPCYCLTKAAEHQLHEEGCLYRIVREGVSEIESLRAEINRLRQAEPVLAKPSFDRNCWVRLMCYFGTDGVWNSDDETADVRALPFSQGLQSDIVAWRNSETTAAADVEKFTNRAIILARRIKSELPHWKVIFVDQSKSGPDVRSKDTIEIEIT